MAIVIGVGAGLIGSIGFRLAEKYLTDLDAIVREYIHGQIPLEEAAQRIQQRLPLHLVLTTGKLVSDGVLGISFTSWVCDLIYSIGSALVNTNMADNFGSVLNLLTQLRTDINRHFSEVNQYGLDSAIIAAMLNMDENSSSSPERLRDPNENALEQGIDGVIEVGIMLLSILRWIVGMVRRFGSFFHTELMKYLLVAWATFQAILQKHRMLTTRVQAFFRHFVRRIERGNNDVSPQQIDINIERRNFNPGERSAEDDSHRQAEMIRSLQEELEFSKTEKQNREDELKAAKDELNAKDGTISELNTQLQSVTARLKEIRMPQFVDLPVTLEQIYSGDTVEVRGHSVNIPPGCRAGTLIEVFEGDTDGHQPRNLPSFIVRIQEVPHRCFQRENQNLIYTATIDLSFLFPQPNRTLQIPSISSEVDHIYEIDNHTTLGEGTQLTIPSAGLPNVDNTLEQGSIIIKLSLRMPTQEEFLALSLRLSHH